jgi:hypothetical protein
MNRREFLSATSLAKLAGEAARRQARRRRRPVTPVRFVMWTVGKVLTRSGQVASGSDRTFF